MKKQTEKDSGKEIKRLKARLAALESEKRKSKKIEEDFKNTQIILNSIINTLPDIIYRLDQDGKIIFVNDVIKKYNYDPEELIGRHIFEIVHPDDLEKAKWRVNERRTGERRTKSFEVRLLSSEKDSIPFEIRSSGVYGGPVFLIDAEGLYNTDDPKTKSFLGTQAIARDISEQKKIESQLRQAQKMEAIGLLAGGVAHDFNNLLTVLLGYTELILSNKTEDNPDYKKLKSIEIASKSAASITKQLLAFSRRQVLYPKIINLNTILNKMEEILRRLIKENIEITYELEENLTNIKTDPIQMEQIILNLTHNASDSMPDGGEIKIRTKNEYLDEKFAEKHIGSKPGSYVKLSITDTGFGMSEEVIENIFEPFFTTKELGRGTGLGLATVYGIIKQSNGNIWVESEVGKGTTFDIYFPQCDKKISVDEQTEIQDKKPPKSATIMVVEDKKDLRLIISESLRQYGYAVIEAADGEDALKKYKSSKKRIDLLLTDVIMPKMGGIELVKRITTDNSKIKVIYISGYAHDNLAKMGVMDVNKVFIQKPFMINDLLVRVKEVLVKK
jgi:two-component system cell cycle sensor histidine kinase/response regulator CckA